METKNDIDKIAIWKKCLLEKGVQSLETLLITLRWMCSSVPAILVLQYSNDWTLSVYWHIKHILLFWRIRISTSKLEGLVSLLPTPGWSCCSKWKVQVPRGSVHE